AALRYVRHAPLTRALMLRSGAVMFCASAIFALLPAVARGLSRSATGYGLLLGAFGLGAIAGAVVMQRARAKFSAEAVVSTAIGVVGASAIAVAMTRTLAGALAVMLVGGGAWITFISLANAAVQRLAPDWVRARIL